MEGVQRRGAVHTVDSEETLDPGQGNSETEYHNRSLDFGNQRYNKNPSRLQNFVKNATFVQVDNFDAYRSIAARSEGLFKDNGSRFIALAYPVETEEEVKEIVAGLKKEYHDARHHCYAYRLGYKGDRFRANDDGEPSGSAGRPILGQIDSMGLSDILVVVVRYFGGIKLGIPGLIRAYKTSTADALSQAEVIDKVAGKTFRVSFDYLSMNAVMKVLKDLGLAASSQDFGLACALDVRVRLALEEDFRKRLAEIAKLEEK
ncbi:MAG: YigZ family protein [Bacteroidales bacterium]|nr:YigZ family protein [Bacteroidales bacterium]